MRWDRNWCLAAVWLGLLLLPGLVPAQVAATGPDMRPLAWRVGYDTSGRVAQRVNPAGRVTIFAYTPPSGEPLQSITQTPPEGTPVTWRFDDQGRLAAMTDDAGEVAYRYDRRGQLEEIQRRDSPAIRYAYDIAGRLTELRVGDIYRIAWTYDFLGRVEKMDTPAGVIGYEYQTGLNTVIRSLPNGIKTFWKRQANGQLEQITHGFFKKPDDTECAVLAEYSYQHAPDGRIAAIHEVTPQGNIVRQYTYDTMGRLIHATGAAGQVYSYAYDLVGNRLKATASGHPDQNCTYDWAGRLTGVDGNPCACDACGNLTDVTLDGVARTYRYQPDGCLAEAKFSGDAVQYRYDGAGRLLARKTATGETRFIPNPCAAYWQPLVMEEPDGKRTLIIWDRSTPLATVRDGQVEWLLHDHLGSVRAVADNKGEVKRQSEYDPFGVLKDADKSKTTFAGFAGLFWDSRANGYFSAIAFRPTPLPARLGGSSRRLVA